MKAIEDVDGLARLLGNHLEVGSPHVTADELNGGSAFPSEPAEEAHQGLDLPLLSNSQEPFAVGIDLVGQGQVLVAPLPLDLVDADGLDALLGPSTRPYRLSTHRFYRRALFSRRSVAAGRSWPGRRLKRT